MKTDQVIYKKTVRFIDEEHIAIKPLCDFFGIDYQHQARKFKEDKFLQQLSCKNTTVAFDGRQRSMISVQKDAFLLWVCGISHNIVDPNLREKFIEFKLHIHEYFERLQGDASFYRQKFFELKELINQDASINFTRVKLTYDRKTIRKRMLDIIDDQLDLELDSASAALNEQQGAE
jgi:hypothetical protein